MKENIPPIGVLHFIQKFMKDEEIFRRLPEFSFIKPLAEKWKSNECSVGLNEELDRVTEIYNDFVMTCLPEDILNRVTETFKVLHPCFEIKTNQKYAMKCF